MRPEVIFMAFAPAGAFACAYAGWYATRIPVADYGVLQAATRWCAFGPLSVICHTACKIWGILLGAGARANAFDNPELGLYFQILALALLFAGVACFALILFRKKNIRQSCLCWFVSVFLRPGCAQGNAYIE